MATKKKCDCDEIERYKDSYWREVSRHRGTRRRARGLSKQIKELRVYLEQAALAIEKLCADKGDAEMAFVVQALRRQAFPAKAVR